jgi:hypothetical protein
MAFSPSQLPANRAAHLPRFKLGIGAFCLCLLTAFPILGQDIGVAVSPVFTVDTHWNGWPGDLGIEHVSTGESNVFSGNTAWNSWPGGLLRHKEGSGESGVFTADATETDHRVSAESAVFTVDTRMPTFNLQGGSVSWLDGDRLLLDISVNNISNTAWPIKIDVTFEAQGITYFAPESETNLYSQPGVANVPRIVRVDSVRAANGDSLPYDESLTVKVQLREGVLPASAVTTIGSVRWLPDVDGVLTVTNVLAEEQGLATIVTVDFDYLDPANVPIDLGLAASSDNGITWHLIPVATVTGLTSLAPTALLQSHTLVWSIGLDWPKNFSNRLLVQVVNTANGDSAIGGPITVDTRSAFLASSVSSPYSSPLRAAIFIDDVPFDVTFTVDPEWGSRTPGHIEFHTPLGIFEQPADETSRTFNVGAGFGPGGRLRVVLVDVAGDASGSVDANIAVVAPPMGIGGSQMQLSTAVDGYTYSLRDDANFAFTILDEAPAVVDTLVPGFTDSQLGFGPLTIPAPVLQIDSSGTASVRGQNTGAYHAGGEALAVDLSIDLLYHYGTDAWVLDRGDATVSIDDEITVTPGLTSPPSNVLPVALRLGGQLFGDFSVPLTVQNADNGTLSFATSFESHLEGKWAAAGEAQRGINFETSLGVEAEINYVLPPGSGRERSALSLIGIVRQVAMGYQSVQTFWLQDWFENAARGAAREFGAAGQWSPFQRSYLPLRGQAQPDPGATAPLAGIMTTLDTNVYPFSQPALATSGSETMLLWVEDDGARTDRNRSSVMWRLRKNGVWSGDSQLQVDGTADFSPTIVASTSGFTAAWESMNRTFGETDDLDDLIASQEIIAGRYDSSQGTWAIDRLTNDNVLDRSPVLSVSGDKAMLLWVRNNNNHLVGTNVNGNVLMFSFYTPGGGWSSPGGIAANVAPVLHIGAAWDGTTAHAFYTIDEDYDLSTDEDREIHSATYTVGIGWSGLIPITANSVPDTNPEAQFAGDGSLHVYWYQNGAIKHSQSALLANSQTIVTTSGVSGADDFTFTTDGTEKALVWGGSVSGGQQIIASIFDSDDAVWLPAAALSGGSPIARNPAAVFDPSGTLRVVYDQVPVLPTDFGVLTPISDGIVEVNEPDFRAVSLVEIAQANQPDLQVSFIAFSPQPTPGADSTVSASITNNGHADIGAEFTVRFFDNDPNAGGALIGVQTVSSLARGATSVVTADWSVPANSAAKVIYVLVDQTDQIVEQDETNNTGTAFGVVPDLRISQVLSSYGLNGNAIITVEIANDGLVSVPSFVVSLHQDSPSGSEVARSTPTIAAGGVTRVSLDLASRIDTTLAIVLDPTNAVPESDEANNVGYAYTNLPVAARPSITPEAGILTGDTFAQIITSVPGGTIHYTLDGTLPTTDSPTYNGPILVNASVQVRARVFAINRQPSDVAGANYRFINENRVPRITGLSAAPTGDSSNAALFSAEVTDFDGSLIFHTWSAPDHPSVTFDEGINGTFSADNIRIDFPGPGVYRIVLNVFDIIDEAARSILIEVPIDSDADLLADHWELIHFGDLSEGRDDDPDDDGLSNHLEFVSGSDPGGDFELILAGLSPGTADVLPSRNPGVAETISVNENSSQIFSVVPDRGTPPYLYTWSRDGEVIPGATQSSFSFTPAYTDIAHPAQSRDSIISCEVSDSGSQITATANWQLVQILDVDQLASAPVGVVVSPDNPDSTDDLALSGGSLNAADPDGDAVVGIGYEWQLLPATIDGPNLAAGSTRKGQTWQGLAYAQTDPYGLGIVPNRPAVVARTIGNIAPIGVAKTIPIDIDTPIQVVLAANDQDVTDGADSLTYSIISPPQHGTLTNFDGATGRVIYTVDRREALHDSLIFTARDEDGATTAQTTVLLEIGWQFPVTVSNGHVDELRLGIHRDASSDFDIALDEATPTDLGGKARVSIQAQPDPLRVDFREISDAARWIVDVENAFHAVPVTLAWDSALLPDSGLFLFEIDENGDPVPDSPIIDMRNASEFEVPASTNSSLAITYREVTFDITLRSGWNLISMPIIPLHDVSRSFGHLDIHRAFGWDGNNFSAFTTLEVGVGYFLFHRGRNTVTVSVRGATSLETIHQLADNWNLAGPISDPPFSARPIADTLAPTDRLLTEQIWAWLSRSRIYQEHVGDLDPGTGYWMYVLPE